MKTNGADTPKRDALAQLDATLAAMRRLAAMATELAHALEQAQKALTHNGDALWGSAPDATAAMAWQIAQMNATRALATADELTPAAAGKAMPSEVQQEAEAACSA